LANTKEVLGIVNRSGSVHSAHNAAAYLDKAICACLAGGFKRVRMRGDCKFSQTEYLDGWDALGVRFQFGYEAKTNLKEIADSLEESVWKKLSRPLPQNKTDAVRTKPKNVKREIIRQRGYVHLELLHEEVAEFEYRPNACENPYRMIVVRKNISKEQGEVRLLDEIRYFFYISNVSVAWNLKSWSALLIPEEPEQKTEHRAEKKRLLTMEFKTFLSVFIHIPCQIVRHARRTTHRLLSYTAYTPAFFRLCGVRIGRRARLRTP
jgi:hypothetical protein